LNKTRFKYLSSGGVIPDDIKSKVEGDEIVFPETILGLVIQGKHIDKAIQLSLAYFEQTLERNEYQNLPKVLANFTALGNVGLGG